jgi:hypothetical protein
MRLAGEGVWGPPRDLDAAGAVLREAVALGVQLDISVSFLKDSIREDPSAPLIVGRGLIACNTPTLQSWWDGNRHHGR